MIRPIATVGGVLGRKGDGEPGVKTLWLGLQRVADFSARLRNMHARQGLYEMYVMGMLIAVPCRECPATRHSAFLWGACGESAWQPGARRLPRGEQILLTQRLTHVSRFPQREQPALFAAPRCRFRSFASASLSSRSLPDHLAEQVDSKFIQHRCPYAPIVSALSASQSSCRPNALR